MVKAVYLRTNRFEVELEWITFNAKQFEYLCAVDFLFPAGKVWDHRPVVGLDVMRHPRHPSVLLLLFCFGVGCVVLKFHSWEALPSPIHRFLRDKRIHFVGFGIPEKKELFPFDDFGLSKHDGDIGYLAAKILKDPKYKRWGLSELARKVLGIKRMIGLAEASSLERHEQIKCAICQLFITSVIAMGLVRARGEKRMDASPQKSSFLKNLNMLPVLAEGWFKSPKRKQKTPMNGLNEEHDYIYAKKVEMDDMFDNRDFTKTKYKEHQLDNWLVDAKGDALFHNIQRSSTGDDLDHTKFIKTVPDEATALVTVTNEIWCNDSRKEISIAIKKPLKGILKCPSSISGFTTPSIANSPPSASKQDSVPGGVQLRRANSKGFNVSFGHLL